MSPPENPNDKVTRADLDKQLEVHAKTIELQILLSQQQEKILEKLAENTATHDEIIGEIGKVKAAIEVIDKRTWKQTWLFWGIIGSLIATSISIITKMALS